MKSIVMALLAMGHINIRDLPITEHKTSVISIPDLYIEFEQQHENTILRYDPCIHQDYALWKGKWLTHPIEISYIIYWVEYQHRECVRDLWQSHVLAMHLTTSDEIVRTSGPYYDLGESFDVTGATFRDHNRYRLVVDIHGFTSNDLKTQQNIHGQFHDHFNSAWVYQRDTANLASVLVQ